MTNGKGAKRQRQKEQRRARMEQEAKAQQARQRRRRTINLGVLALIGVIVAYLVMDPGSEKKTASKGETKCKISQSEAPASKKVDRPGNPTKDDRAKKYTATVETTEGSVDIALANDISPCTVNSFVHLARVGFYDETPIHRIVKDFAIQGGDPTGQGTGGPGYKTVDKPPAGTKYTKGTVAMAKGGPEAPGTAGSQFFFVPGDGAGSLPAEYAVLGRVTKGEDTLARLNAIPTEAKDPGGEQSSPVKPVSISKVTIK